MLFIYPPIWLLAFIHQTVTIVDKWSLGQYFSVFSSPPGLDQGVQYGYIIPQMNMAVSMAMAPIANHIYIHLILRAG